MCPLQAGSQAQGHRLASLRQPPGTHVYMCLQVHSNPRVSSLLQLTRKHWRAPLLMSRVPGPPPDFPVPPRSVDSSQRLLVGQIASGFPGCAVIPVPSRQPQREQEPARGRWNESLAPFALVTQTSLAVPECCPRTSETPQDAGLPKLQQ